MVIRLANGKSTTIDYREMGPAAAHRNVYLDANGAYIPESSTYGHKAAGVPGSVAGMAYALEKYGTMKWADGGRTGAPFRCRRLPGVVSARIESQEREQGTLTLSRIQTHLPARWTVL